MVRASSIVPIRHMIAHKPLIVSLMLSGCGNSIIYDSEIFLIPFEKVIARVDRGSIEFTSVDSEVVDVSHYYEWSNSEPEWDIAVRDGVLYVESKCPEKGFCEHHFTVPARPNTEIDVVLKNGDLIVYGMGISNLICGNCAVELLSVEDDITLSLLDGSVFGDSILSPNVRIDAQNADFEIALLELNTAKFETLKGDIHILLPTGSYNLNIPSNSFLMGISDDPTSNQLITASTGDGEIKVTAIKE